MPAVGTRVPAAVVLVGAAATLLKLVVAARTHGTDDVRYWTEFMAGVMHHGPVGIYGLDGTAALYNHPPLVGWMLLVDGHLADLGLSTPFLVRVPASVADLASTMLVWALVRRVSGDSAAALAAVAFTLSPLGFVISGFHGNNDPLFAMLVLAATWLLVTGRSPLIAGVALGLGVSVKIVAVVALPVLLVLAFRRSRGALLSLVGGGGIVFLAIWAPALLLEPGGVLHHVLGYAGNDIRQWGLSQLLTWSGMPTTATVATGDALRFGVVLTAMLVPAALALAPGRSERQLLACAGLPLVLMTLLSPSFAMQYLSWPLAAAYLVAPWAAATTYNALASTYALLVYSRWNAAPPWDWDVAFSSVVPGPLLPFMVLAFLALLVVTVRGLHELPVRQSLAAQADRGRSGLVPVGARPRPTEDAHV